MPPLHPVNKYDAKAYTRMRLFSINIVCQKQVVTIYRSQFMKKLFRTYQEDFYSYSKGLLSSGIESSL